MVVDVGSEGLHTSDEQPQPDAKLAAINQQRVSHIALGQHKRLCTGQPAEKAKRSIPAGSAAFLLALPDCAGTCKLQADAAGPAQPSAYTHTWAVLWHGRLRRLAAAPAPCPSAVLS